MCTMAVFELFYGADTMKRFSLLPVMWVVAVVAMGAYLETARSTRAFVRSAAGTSDVTLADLTWDALPSDRHKLSRKGNSPVFHFTASADDLSCSDVEIWGYSRGCTAQLQWVGGVTGGALVTDDSTFMADTITTTTDETAAGVSILDGGGNDRHATLRFDGAELEYWVVRFPSLGSGTMNCYVTTY